MTEEAVPNLGEARRRFRNGEWRARVFRDLVLGSILDRTEEGEPVVALDIGCGRGIEDSTSLQASLAEAADRLVGVEPDEGMEAPACFEAVHRTILEEAPIPAASIHVAYSYFVLEHVESPESFFRALHDVLVPGGVFWGCTMDRRHPFSAASTLLENLGWKDRYLDRLQGTKGEERYENYPT